MSNDTWMVLAGVERALALDSEPGRCGSTVSDHSVQGATAIVSAASPPAAAPVPVSVPVMRPSAAATPR
ncbi:hypothetical protein MAHJHV51_54260 [Mycobacterium avium subsp. hominissuis]